MHLGLPLADVPTCEAACASIEAGALFSPSSLAEHARALTALVVRVKRCVRIATLDEGDEDGEDEDEEFAYPAVPLLFDGATLRAVKGVAEL